jgi:hypothetical protein
MAVEGTLEGPNGELLFVGTDGIVELTVFEADGVTPKDILGWTIWLDIRKKDTTADPALLLKQGTVQGVFNVDPDLNAQVCRWALSDDDLAVTIFPKDDEKLRYSIKRTDAGAEQILRFGDATIMRVTQV